MKNIQLFLDVFVLVLLVLIHLYRQEEHEDIEKELDIFHILNGILAKTRNIIF